MRTVLAVVVGYVALFAVVFILLTALYLTMGPERAFAPESFSPSTTWLGLMFIVGLIAAIVGGKVCGKIGAGKGIPGLIGLILVLSLIEILGVMNAEDPGARGAELSSMEAMMQARTPLWVALANPVIGVIGVLIGARGSKKS